MPRVVLAKLDCSSNNHQLLCLQRKVSVVIVLLVLLSVLTVSECGEYTQPCSAAIHMPCISDHQFKVLIRQACSHLLHKE
jgi:hypothetical protein